MSSESKWKMCFVLFCVHLLSLSEVEILSTRTHESENVARPMKMVCDENIEEKQSHNHPLTNGSFTNETGPIVLLQNKHSLKADLILSRHVGITVIIKCQLDIISTRFHTQKLFVSMTTLTDAKYSHVLSMVDDSKILRVPCDLQNSKSNVK